MEDHMTSRIPNSGSSVPLKKSAVNIDDIDIVLLCNDDLILTTLIVNQLKKKGATKIRLCYPKDQIKYETANIDAIKIPGRWESQVHFEWGILDATVVISLLYNNFEKQEMLFNACIRKDVSLFVTWDSGMELESHIKDKGCPRTRLHEKLLKTKCGMHWILFQVGIFDEEILKYDVSTITTAFNCPNQYIFLNVTVREDLAHIVVEVIKSNKVQYDRNYVVGGFIAHTFLGHAYQVANDGIKLNLEMPATITEFEISNQLRLTGIVSAHPLPKILYPNCNVYYQKIGVEISFQHDATIYKILKHHKEISLKDWINNRISG